METVLITGGTGLIGKELTNLLIEKKYRVIILTRKIPAKAAAIKGIQYATWNVEKQTIDKEAIEKADYVIHLAGANVAEKRWTQKRKLEIVNSRVESGKLLSNAIATVPNKIKAVISSSAIGWYGPDTEKSLQNGFVENDAADTHFLGKTC
ncbi:MAG: NAD-dependent epimerase/dehydratase family protein, partial [Chitinophagaceae bacterium]